MGSMYRFGAILTLAGLFGACSDSGNTARVDLLLTDAAGDVAAAWVDLAEVYLQGTGGRTDLLGGSTGLVEVTSLQGTALELAHGVELTPGSYAQLRYVIQRAVLETLDGQVFSMGGATHPDGLETTGVLRCPSCNASGLKVVLGSGGVTLEAGENILVLDFEVAESFGREAGNSGMWVMHPVIHATEVVGGVPASIAGTVTSNVTIPECGGAARTVADFVPQAVAASLTDDVGDPIVRSGVVEADGTFFMGFIDPDDYAMSAMASLPLMGAALEFAWDVLPTDVTVGAGESVTGVAYTITSATCQTP